MSVGPSPSAPAPVERPRLSVVAGTTARAALEAAGVGLAGADGAVAVRDVNDGTLRDLDVAFGASADVEPVA
ncbi:MAG: hypothetical protein M3140_10495, partial [Actinomycetota bacterium]|nr:hypothetical protein [Actinomycetota bacterium]